MFGLDAVLAAGLARERFEQEREMRMNNQSKSPAALARLHREAAQRGMVQSRGHVDDEFAKLFDHLARTGQIPNRGARFGEPSQQEWAAQQQSIWAKKNEPITPHKTSKVPASMVKRRSAADECRRIEEMGAHSYLLERHQEFVQDVRLP